MAETVENITRRRGDTYPISLRVQDSGGDAVDLSATGYAFLMTVSSEQNPTGTSNELFQLTGIITSASEGRVEFRPSESDVDAIGVFYYDIEMTDDEGYITTLVTGEFELEQDITK